MLVEESIGFPFDMRIGTGTSGAIGVGTASPFSVFNFFEDFCLFKSFSKIKHILWHSFSTGSESTKIHFFISRLNFWAFLVKWPIYQQKRRISPQKQSHDCLLPRLIFRVLPQSFKLKFDFWSPRKIEHILALSSLAKLLAILIISFSLIRIPRISLFITRHPSENRFRLAELNYSEITHRGSCRKILWSWIHHF